MLGAQLGEEALPVFNVIVDSEETSHVYVGQQPLTATDNHVCVCICFGQRLNNKKLLIQRSLSLNY